MAKRLSGILLHITSLPGPYGIGDLGPSAFAMVDFLKSAGQSYWQILPINPTDGINGHSPYSCSSAFAGNSLLISPQMMVVDGFLTPKDLRGMALSGSASVDYPKTGKFKEKIFNLAYRRWVKLERHKEFTDFCQANASWLEDYAIFAAAKEVFGGRCWNEWPLNIRRRQSAALAQFAKQHADLVGRVKFVQFIFFKQWMRLKAYAEERGVGMIGDIPIYVNYDSADVWCHSRFFKLDAQGALKFVSGCPPDYFSKTGQRWGNPVYDWAKLKQDKYRWWEARIGHNLSLFHCLRIDHFRGFASFWQIPAEEKFAVFGSWVKGPGEHFFKALSKRFKHLPLIAEDLGELSHDAIRLMKKFKFPGMRVLLFGFSGNAQENPHVPVNYPTNAVAYTGTHDNNTIQGWFHTEARPHEKANIAKTLGLKKFSVKELHWAMIRSLFNSKAYLAIIPMADVLGLGALSRMNTPATKVNNWKWRLNDQALRKVTAQKLMALTRQSGRI